MGSVLRALLLTLPSFLQSDTALRAEILALRHQVTVLQRQLGGRRVRLERMDRILHPTRPARPGRVAGARASLRGCSGANGQERLSHERGLGLCTGAANLALCRSTPSDEPVTLHPAVARALSLMQGEGLSLSRDELAARCRVAPTHLSRLFVQELGQSLRDVRSRKRLARCQELLASGQCDSLTEAALEGGFGSYSQFHRVFTQLTGRSPSGRTRSR